MAQKLRDLAVKTGEYTSGGETKGRWQNIGALMKGDDGNEFIILHRWFNPAGVPNPENRDSVIVSCFKADNQKQGQQQAPQQQNNGQAYRNAQNGAPPQNNQQQAPQNSYPEWDDSEIPL